MNHEKKSLLESILGTKLEISSAYDSILTNNEPLQIFSNELYWGIRNFFEADAPFFSTSLPLERIVRYKDGSYSSMAKSIRNNIEKHEGYELISGLDIANRFMYHAMPQLKSRLAFIFSDLVNENRSHLEFLRNNLLVPSISQLKSTSDFTQQIVEDIEEISKSQELTTATLANLQSQRRALKETFYNHIEQLNSLLSQGHNYPGNEQNIASNYLLARYSLSYFIATQVLECIISGNLDDASINKLHERVKQCLNDLNNTSQMVARSFEWKIQANHQEINNINYSYQWSIDYFRDARIHNLRNQNFSMQNIMSTSLKDFDIEYEMKRLQDFIDARKIIIQRIEIKKEEK